MESQALIPKEQIYNWLRNDDTLKRIIKDIVQNNNFLESYYKKLLEDHDLQRKIEYIVQQQMNNVTQFITGKMSKAKSELQSLKEQARRDIATEILLNLPNQVASEIAKQMPSYLNDNKQMQKILEEHSKGLTQQLEEVARQHLNNIVNEDQYHIVNERYFSAFEQKGQEAINSHTFKVEQQIQSSNTRNSQLHEELNRKYNTDIGGLQQELLKLVYIKKDITNLQSDLSKLKEEKKELESSLFNFKVGTILVSVSAISIWLFKKFH